MPTSEFQDLDIRFERGDGGHRAVVVQSPAGEGFEAGFHQPVSELALENFVLKIGRRGRVRGIDAAQSAQAKELGGQLFEALFHDDLLMCLRESLRVTGNESQGLRIRLRLGSTPELGALPWEYLYDRRFNRFLCLSDWTPVVRYPELLEPLRPLSLARPLRILVMISSPSDYPALDVEQEWARLQESVGGLEASGKVLVERLADASLETLRRHLRRNDYHVLHFIGHGGFSESDGQGVLVFTDEDGSGCWVSGESLGIDLHDALSLRLVVLNACEGARSDTSDPFSSVAMSILQQGLPAVVAMQFEISDRAAITFGNEFYAALADGLGVDAGMGQARKAIHDFSGLEWATPVLYLRAADGRLFDLSGPPAPAPPVPPSGAQPPREPRLEPVTPAGPDPRGIGGRSRWSRVPRRTRVIVAGVIVVLLGAGVLARILTGGPTPAPAAPAGRLLDSLAGVDTHCSAQTPFNQVQDQVACDHGGFFIWDDAAPDASGWADKFGFPRSGDRLQGGDCSQVPPDGKAYFQALPLQGDPTGLLLCGWKNYGGADHLSIFWTIDRQRLSFEDNLLDPATYRDDLKTALAMHDKLS